MAPRVLVIGLGSIGSRHARLIRDELGYEVVALRTHLGQQPTDQVVPELCSWAEVDGHGFDVALVTNPTDLHIETALRCADRGMHLFIEKPLDCRVEGLDRLVELARSRQITTYVAYPLRFHPVVRRLKEQLSGRVVHHASMICASYLPNWRPKQDYRKMYSCFRDKGGGVLLDMSHELDTAVHLFGPIHELRGSLSRLSGLTADSEDCADLIAVHNHTVTNIHLNYFSTHPRRYAEVDLEGGFLRADILGGHITGTSAGTTETESFQVDIDLMYAEQLRYFFANLGRTDLDNSVDRAGSLFRTIIEFREEQGYGSTGDYLRARGVSGG